MQKARDKNKNKIKLKIYTSNYIIKKLNYKIFIIKNNRIETNNEIRRFDNSPRNRNRFFANVFYLEKLIKLNSSKTKISSISKTIQLD